MQRPSAANEWQMPHAAVLPILPSFPFLSTPLEVHATSYFAASERISNLRSRGSCSITVKTGSYSCAARRIRITNPFNQNTCSECMFYYTGTGTQFQAENDWILNEFSIPYVFLYDFFNHMLFWCGMMLLNSDANEHRHALRADLS